MPRAASDGERLAHEHGRRLSQSASASRAGVHIQACPRCGTDWRTVCEDGMLGCATCYDVFFVDLVSLLEQVHSV